jgi:YggT family protein
MQLQVVLNRLIDLFGTFLVLRVIIDYIRLFARSWRPNTFLLGIFEVIYTVTERPMAFVRRYIPPLRIGGVGIDLSFIILWAMGIPLAHAIVNLLFSKI